MEKEFDWEKLFDGRPRRRLMPTPMLLEKLGVTQEYWSMVEFFGDMRHEHPALWEKPPIDDALALGMQALEARYAICRRRFESFPELQPSEKTLERDKAVLDKVIRDIYSGDPVARQVDELQDSVRGGDGDLYRRISEEREKKTGGK